MKDWEKDIAAFTASTIENFSDYSPSNLIFKKFHLLQCIPNVTRLYGNMEQYSTDNFEKTHKRIIKKPLSTASNAHQKSAIIRSYQVLISTRKVAIQTLLKRERKANPPPLSLPLLSHPGRKLEYTPEDQHFTLDCEVRTIFQHNSIKLVGFINPIRTPFLKLYQSKASFFKFVEGGNFAVGRVSKLLDINGEPYVYSELFGELNPPENGALMRMKYYQSLQKLVYIHAKNILSAVHMVPDATLSRLHKLVLTGMYWLNETAVSF